MSKYKNISFYLKSTKVAWIVVIFLGFYFITGCKKLVEVGSPDNVLTSNSVYTNDQTASAVFINLYSYLSSISPQTPGLISSLSLVGGLSADELTLYGGGTNSNTTLVQFYQNSLLAASAPGIWGSEYSPNGIYTVNLALENLANSTGLTSSVKQQLTGEAKFLRAFYYFYLVNLYGDVPLATTSNYQINAVLARTPSTLVYEQIITDLKDAQNLLSDGYVGTDAKSNTSERVRPNKWAATALLARAYLYKGNYDSAEMEATLVINNTTLYDTVSLKNVFLKNSREAIWQLQPVNTGWNTEDGRVFVLPPTGPTSNSASSGYPVYMSPQLLSSFESGDERRINWIDSVIVNGTIYFFPFKYKSATLNASVTEYTMVLRLGEQYLIRAEARANQNKILDAQYDLNLIRTRAGLPVTTAVDQNSLLAAIQHERQVELFTEWGHRWLDLKRTNTVDAVMNAVAPEKGSFWNSNWQWYPIQASEIIQDPKLVQNSGY